MLFMSVFYLVLFMIGPTALDVQEGRLPGGSVSADLKDEWKRQGEGRKYMCRGGKGQCVRTAALGCGAGGHLTHSQRRWEAL